MSVQLGVRVDKKLKDDATAVLRSMGLDMTTAVRMFLTQTVITNSIPFEVKAYDETRYDNDGNYITDEMLLEYKKWLSDNVRTVSKVKKLDLSVQQDLEDLFDEG